jgi:hypothetical protein
MVDELNRDIQLVIIKKLGIEARIAYGIIGKIKVPDHLRHLLDNSFKRLVRCRPKSSEIRLGIYTLGCYWFDGGVPIWYCTNWHIEVTMRLYKEIRTHIITYESLDGTVWEPMMRGFVGFDR